MDKSVANQLLQRELAALRARGYARLRAELGSESKRTHGPDGREYQLKTLVTWDDKESGALRIIVSIDDGGWRSWLRPLTADDLVAPERG